MSIERWKNKATHEAGDSGGEEQDDLTRSSDGSTTEQVPQKEIEEIFQGVSNLLKEVPTGINKVEYLLQKARERTSERFAGHEAEFTDFFAALAGLEETDDIQLAQQAARAWQTAIDLVGRKKMEQWRRDAWLVDRNTETSLIPLTENKAIAYERIGNELALHVGIAKTLTSVEKLRTIQQGLAELARQLQTDQLLQSIETISATSWIVADNPKLLERLGFTVNGPIDEATRQKDFPDNPSEIWRASITKEELLKRYT